MRRAAHYASSMLHPRPFYYLENFCTALAWLRQRYGDLLNATEHAFIARFHELPRESAALLVRMIGRKGDLFRTSRLIWPDPVKWHSAVSRDFRRSDYNDEFDVSLDRRMGNATRRQS